MIQFQENAWTDGRTQGGKDGETLFYRTLQATTGGPKDYKKSFKQPPVFI